MSGGEGYAELAEVAELRERLRLLDEATGSIGDSYADLARSVTSVATSGREQGQQLEQLATQLVGFMQTTRATLELLAERVDELAVRIGGMPAPDDGGEEHRRN